jgi:hypothetical protein
VGAELFLSRKPPTLPCLEPWLSMAMGGGARHIGEKDAWKTRLRCSDGQLEQFSG